MFAKDALSLGKNPSFKAWPEQRLDETIKCIINTKGDRLRGLAYI